MSLQIGIVGLPNVGKSTLFNALTRSKGAEVANYPFCTINPNVGMVQVPDDRLSQLATIVNPEKIIPAVCEFVDIAGLVKGASEGEGLGNQFLSHIRECHAILQVVRHFADSNIQHVHETVDPRRDVEIIQTELILADLQTMGKQATALERGTRSGDPLAIELWTAFKKVYDALNQGQLASSVSLSPEEKLLLRDFHLISMKPVLYAVNVSEDQIGHLNLSQLKVELGLSPAAPLIPVSAKVEEELNALSESERAPFLESLGLERSSLDQLITAAYDLLGLQTFLTAGPKEVKAWTIQKGWKAPEAAGVIHTDFVKGFIRAEICDWKDYIQLRGEAGVREKGKMRVEGKEYVMREGDVVHFLIKT